MVTFDWFVYGSLEENGVSVQPTLYTKKFFKEIIGRPMPQDSKEITFEENIIYKREILAKQFYAIRNAVKETSPETKIIFNVPYRKANSPLWKEHPMLKESDGLFSECTDEEIGNWLCSIRGPNQRVMITIRGHAGEHLKANPNDWFKWYERGCDLFAYTFGTPPDFRPHPMFKEEVSIIHNAFRQI